jgi:hypothetical protein
MDLLLASFNVVSTVDFPTRLQNNSANCNRQYIYWPISARELCSISLSDHDAQWIALTELRSFISNMGKKNNEYSRNRLYRC